MHCVMLLLLCRMWFDLIFNSQLFESVSELGHASIRRATRCSCSLCLLQRMLCQVRCTSPRRLQPVLCPGPPRMDSRITVYLRGSQSIGWVG